MADEPDLILPGTTPFPSAAVAINIVLKMAEVLGLDSDDDTTPEVKAKLLALLALTPGDVDGLADALAGKMDATGEAAKTALSALTGADRLSWNALTGLSSSGAGALYQTAIIAAATLAANGWLRTNGDASGFEAVPGEGITAATLDEYLTGTDDEKLVTADVARYMEVVRVKAYAATTILSLNGQRTADGDGADSDGLVTSIAATGNLDVQFNAIHAGLVGRVGLLHVGNSGGGSITVTMTAANGISIETADGISNPGIGTGDGDTLDVIYRVISPQLVRIEGYVEGTTPSVPVLVGFANSNSGNPSIPEHQAGDLIVAIGYTTGLTLPDLPSGFSDWAPDAGSQSGNNVSVRLCYQIASGPGTTIAWTGAQASRSVWVFRNAQIDLNAFVNSAADADCEWPTLALSTDSLVGLYAAKASTQTDISVIQPAGAWNERVGRDATTACYVADSAALLTTFAPAATTFDNAAGTHQLVAFSVKGA